jgi:hypothetical protein
MTALIEGGRSGVVGNVVLMALFFIGKISVCGQTKADCDWGRPFGCGKGTDV